MAEQIGSLLALAGGKRPRAASSSHRAAMLRRLRSALNDQFHDAALTPAGVARDHGISVRNLHTLFAQSGTSFGSELMSIRLDRSSAMLKDRRFDGLAIAEIAWCCGFRDPRAFMTPSGTSADSYIFSAAYASDPAAAKAGHSPFFSHPAQLAKLIADAAA